MTSVLICGANGQLGWELARQFKSLDVNALGLDLPTFDLTDFSHVDTVLNREKPDLVINAAAYTDVDQAEKDVEKAYRVNAEGPLYLAGACSEAKIPLIHVSTDYVFDGMVREPYSEDDPVNPICVYGQSKEAGERNVREKIDEHIIIRTSWLYGVHGHNFVKTMLHLGKENKMIKVVNDQFGCPTYAADLAEAITKITEAIRDKREFSWGTYHFCGEGVVTWYEFAAKIFETAEQYIPLKVTDLKPIPTNEYPTPARRPSYSVLNCDKIKKEFNVNPKPWYNSLEKMIDILFRDD